MTDPHVLWAVAQLLPGEGIVDGVARIATLLAEDRDCRTCRSFYDWEDGVCKQSNKNPCTNADRYDPLPVVQLWGKT